MKPAAILDIGSSKVVCLSGSVSDKGGIVVHGAGVSGCDGYTEDRFPMRSLTPFRRRNRNRTRASATSR